MTAKVGQSLGLGKGAGDRLVLEEAGDSSESAAGWVVWVVWVVWPAGGALLELWDEGGAHSAFEPALGGFVFGLDLFGRFAFVGVFGQNFGRVWGWRFRWVLRGGVWLEIGWRGGGRFFGVGFGGGVGRG